MYEKQTVLIENLDYEYICDYKNIHIKYHY